MVRKFSRRQKNKLYRLAKGRCQYCGEPLGDDWEADHRIPFILGGHTTIENGLASCQPCNRKKGAQMPDFIPRRFQQDLCDTTIARIMAEEEITTALVGAGSGKTFGWIMTANQIYKDELIDFVVTLVPRLTLRGQAEDDCASYLAMCNPPMMNMVIERDNIEPLIPRDKSGVIKTYQSVVRDDDNMHINWAKKHDGRFLLVLDEAQFVGLKDDEGESGTKISEFIVEMASYALHTIILTATPVRSDGQPLALVKYSDTVDKGIKPIIWDVRATYKEGVASKYLRPCEFHLNNGVGVFTDEETFEIKSLEKRLSKVLRSPDIWEPIIDQTIEKFRICRKLCQDYRCLIAAIDQKHAGDIHKYLKNKYPEFGSMLAISDDPIANKILRAFKPRSKGGSNSGDILVSVEMAYIGYDCPSIAVVGILTSKRWEGWLEQLIMRAGRVWKDRPVEEQTMILVGPNDPQMVKFAERFRSDSDKGLRERREREGDVPPGPDSVYVKSAEITDGVCLGVSVDQDLNAEQTAGLNEFQKSMVTPVSIMGIAEVLRKAGVEIPRSKNTQSAPSRRHKDKRRDWGRIVQEKLKTFLREKEDLSFKEDPKKFRIRIAQLQTQLNKTQNVENAHGLTDVQWQQRITIIDGWIQR